MVSRNIAIILARGGSKRLPRKNMLPMSGAPMLFWTIEAALRAGCFEKVLVSTDDEEIAAIAREFGAEVPFLRKVAFDDVSTSSEATYAALLQAQEYWNCRYDIVVQLMANCPLRGFADIQQAMGSFKSNDSPSQISCFRLGGANLWTAFVMSDDGNSKKIFPEAYGKRSQDLPTLYCPTGAIWIAKVDDFMRHKDFYMVGHRFEPLHWMSAIDIDDEVDLEFARTCFNFKNMPRK